MSDATVLLVENAGVVALRVALWGFKSLLMRFKAYVLYKIRGDFACSHQHGEML